MNIERSKADSILQGMTSGLVPDGLPAIQSFLATENLYLSAIREIATKLEILNDEFKYTKDRNPIHLIRTRVKSPRKIVEKLMRRGLPATVEAARENLTDIAGIRVICPYIDDIYTIARLLLSQDDIGLIRRTDYIRLPKPNGYRSLHLVVTVPVFLSDRTERVTAEIQVRTIAMDFWATLEHELAYGLPEQARTEAVAGELRACADLIAAADVRMQSLYNMIVNPAKDCRDGLRCTV
ncbi:MAG: GTP pyrophosphokinase family protein [Gemmatimonadales bacterium]|nr:GTP pyrophosphokinase family protein [Gemmatimonadales bacterium]